MTFVKCGVIGHPINHSKSPIIHNYWISKYGLNGEYVAIDIAPDALTQGVETLIAQGYKGFNVTIPHKQNIIPLCADIDDTARAIGAVNTVTIRDGKLYGSNTDAFGFIENLHVGAFGVDFVHRPAVVLGAGGAARAIVYSLLEAGAQKIILCNRSKEKANELSSMAPLNIAVEEWELRNDVLKDAGLLMNATSLGMTGKESLTIDLSHLPKDATVCDIVYAPLITDLLHAAEKRGNQIVTGIGMLLHQARPAFEKWFGVLPDVGADLEQKVLG